VVARNKRIQLLIDGKEQGFECGSIAEKRHLFKQLYGWVRSFRTEEQLRHVVRDLAARYQVEIAAFCNELCMTWDELATLAADPLGHRRGPYRQPRDAGESAGVVGAVRNGGDAVRAFFPVWSVFCPLSSTSVL
jgi:hypothetical protein